MTSEKERRGFDSAVVTIAPEMPTDAIVQGGRAEETEEQDVDEEEEATRLRGICGRVGCKIVWIIKIT